MKLQQPERRHGHPAWMVVLILAATLLLPSACGDGRPPATSQTEQERFHYFSLVWQDSISAAPRHLRTEALRRSRECTDSLVSRQYLALALKTCLFTFDLDSARLLIRQIHDYARRAPLSPGLRDLQSECSNMQGNILARTGRTDSAIACFLRAYQLQTEGTRADVLPDILINLADAYNRQGQLDQGAYWYRRALFLCDSLDLPPMQRTPIYYGLGQIYSSLRIFSLCDHYYELAGENYDRMRPFEKHFYLNNRGTTYYLRDDLRTAIGYFRRAIRLTDEYPDMTFELNLSRINLSDCYLGLGMADSAARYLSLCEPFFRQSGVPTALYYLDTQYIRLALLRRDLPQAARLVARATTPPGIDPDMLHIRNRSLIQYYEQAGDYPAAYRVLQQDQHLDDSILNERIRLRVADLTLRYRQDSTLIANRLLMQEQRAEVFRLRQTRFAGLAFGALALLVAGFVYVYNKKKRALILAQSRRMVSSLRLQNIRNRLSPHFIFNVLNQQLSGLDESHRRNLSSLVKLMRRNLELADQLSVTLDEELDFVQTYLDLEQASLGPDFHFTLDIDPAVRPAEVRLPSMLVQIPVENAVKHALKDKPGRRMLRIDVGTTPLGVLIRITDNGGGFRPDSRHAGTGTGMKVVMQTIQILNQHNRRPIEADISNVPLPEGETGCQVIFLLPRQYDSAAL